MNKIGLDMDSLFRAAVRLQTEVKCYNCKQIYEKKWCKDEKTPCLFCKSYLPMRDTYYSILRDIEWQFIKSDEDNRHEFYNAFLDNLHKWSNYFYANVCNSILL